MNYESGAIFEQFFRVPDQKSETGAGLGLAIVSRIIETHHGKIHIKSRPGHGTSVVITLPVK